MPLPKNYTETELLESLKSHDEQAFIYLYDNYSKALFTVIHGIIPQKDAADDILQEVFVKIWQYISTYDSGKGRLYTWMLNIARNRAIDAMRSKDANKQAKTITLEDNVYPGEVMINIKDLGLQKVLNGLPKESRKLLELSYFMGYTQDEISKMLQIPIGTVKTRIRTTLISLRKILGER
ncbi:MAG: polymerase sigma-70 factor [Segetibacter sp.]|nr:polymerase sigma-70 factor [Segetibacter sp.]